MSAARRTRPAPAGDAARSPGGNALRRYAEEFNDASLADAYAHRYPYPQDLFPFLANLTYGPRKIVLDLGCGQGEIARPLAPLVDRIDAVDSAVEMVERGKRAAAGQHVHLRWFVGLAEEVPLEPGYALATAGLSLQWMDWPALFARLRGLLVPGASLAIVTKSREDHAWSAAVRDVIREYRIRRDVPTDFSALVQDVPEAIERGGYFIRAGSWTTATVTHMESQSDYIEALHSRNGLSRASMGVLADEFDDRVQACIGTYTDADVFASRIRADVVWGVLA